MEPVVTPLSYLLRAMGFGAGMTTPVGAATSNVVSGPVLNADGTVPGPMAQEAGAGRGFINPPVAVPSRPALSPLTPVADVNAGRPAVAEGPILSMAMADPRAMENGNGLAAPPAPVVDSVPPKMVNQPSFFSRLMDDSKTGVSPLEYALRGFTAAGTQNPAQTMMQFAAQDAENAKIREAQRARMMPKIVGQAGPNGAIQLVQMPDGSIVPRTLEQVIEMNKTLKSADIAAEIEKAKIIEREKERIRIEGEERKAGRESATERVQAGLNVQQLNQIADSLEKTDTATGPVIGLLPKFVRDVITPQGASLQDAAERIIQGGLRATLGGQFTQVEGDRFLARAYNPRLDEKTNAANLRTIAREIAAMQLDKDNALAYFKQNGTLEGFVPNPNAKPASAAPAAEGNTPVPSAVRTQATAAFGSYEPDKYEYGVNPATGKFARRPKGQ
jgi:hypothetical protein